MTSPYWLPFRLLQCDKSNLDRRGLLFWLPLGRHACFKGNLFGEVLLNQLPFRLPQHDKSNLNRRGLLFGLPLGRHACFKGNLFWEVLAYWLPPFQSHATLSEPYSKMPCLQKTTCRTISIVRQAALTFHFISLHPVMP